jgi:hypothetical protein
MRILAALSAITPKRVAAAAFTVGALGAVGAPAVVTVMASATPTAVAAAPAPAPNMYFK